MFSSFVDAARYAFISASAMAWLDPEKIGQAESFERVSVQ